MHSTSTSTAPPLPPMLGPVGWVGRTMLRSTGYVGGVTLLAMAALSSVFWRRSNRDHATTPGFMKTLMHQLFWMLVTGLPLVGLVHIAIGSFLSLQAYYGSTFVDGTGAVVGVGLLRNMGGMMTGLIFAGILAARMIPEFVAAPLVGRGATSHARLNLGPRAR
jgi:phospholipid/cholesterol/gamma-HCH transport system permease protein